MILRPTVLTPPPPPEKKSPEIKLKIEFQRLEIISGSISSMHTKIERDCQQILMVSKHLNTEYQISRIFQRPSVNIGIQIVSQAKTFGKLSA